VVLQELFLVRLANKLLGLDLESMTFQRCCTLNQDNGIAFDAQDYVMRYLNKNGVIHLAGEFVRVIESWRPQLTDDPRYQMHGHDFIQLLAWYMHKQGAPKALVNPTVVERSLFGCVEVEQLANERLFKLLMDRVSENLTALE
jgi:hypothetical protein